MSEKQNVEASGLNRAKPYQLVLFPLNNGATNVYYVLVLSYIATFGSNVLALGLMFASIMVTAMRLCDAITDPIIGALIDRTNGKFGKFRPFMVIGNLVMAVSIILLYIVTPYIPADMMPLRYVVFVLLYFVWVIGYTFQTSCTRSGQTVLTNDPKQRPLFTIFNTVGSLVGMGVMQFVAPILRANVADYSSADFYRVLTPIGVVISIVLTLLAVIGIWEKDQPKYFGVGGEKQKKVKVSEYIEIIKNNKPMQRLMIARIFLLKPKILLADETTSMVDACSRATILDMLLQLRDEIGMTVIFITHDIGLAYYISDTVYIMEHGRFVEFGKADEVILNPKAAYTKRLISDVPKIHEEWDLSTVELK